MKGHLHGLAALLRKLRTSGRPVPLGAAEALLLIGAGVDSVPELAAAMGDGETPLPPATVSLLVSMLRGRARYCRGKWIESPLGALICVRPHPHRRGMQLLLTEAGAQLLQQVHNPEENQYTSTSLLALSCCAPTENAK